MSRRKNSVPSYCLHKASGQARIVVDGQSIYLGKHGSPESHERYLREVARLTTGADAADPSPLKLHQAVSYDLTVNEVMLRFLQWADQYYRWNGEPTKESHSFVKALRLLRELFGSTPARDFGPKALKTFRPLRLKRVGVGGRSTLASIEFVGCSSGPPVKYSSLHRSSMG